MTRQLFRASAVQRYNERLEKIALPRYAAPPWLRLLWAFFGLLVVFTVCLWAARLPVYASGPAVVALAPTSWLAKPNETVVVVFLPAELAGQVAANQRAHLQFEGLPDSGAEGATSTVTMVEPGTVSPAVARSRYGLDGSTGLLVEGPVVVVLISLPAPAAELLGSVGEAQIEIGLQPGLALLPGIGRFFASDWSQDHAR